MQNTETTIATRIIEDAKNNPFWTIIKNELFIDVPPYLKHLLHFCGFDNAAAIKVITDDKFTEMEEFARNDMMVLVEGWRKSDFFGIYSRIPQRFRILPGHKVLIMEIKRFVEEKGLSHFVTNSGVITTSTLSGVSEVPQIKHQEPVQATPQPPQQQQQLSTILSDEENSLHSLLRNWYLRQIGGSTIFQSFLESPKNRFIEVSRHGTEAMTAPRYSAKISCCLCEAKMRAQKYRYGKPGGGDSKKMRWVIQNFIRHVKEIHLKFMIKSSSYCNNMNNGRKSRGNSFEENLTFKMEPVVVDDDYVDDMEENASSSSLMSRNDTINHDSGEIDEYSTNDSQIDGGERGKDMSHSSRVMNSLLEEWRSD